MQLHSDITLAAMLVVAAGVAIPTSHPASTPVTTASAEVRFTNNLTTSATLNANGEVLFADIHPDQTSEWTTVTDSAVAFTLVVPGEGKPPATATQVIADGARYTVTASPGMSGNPQLSIKREPPLPVPDSTGQR